MTSNTNSPQPEMHNIKKYLMGLPLLASAKSFIWRQLNISYKHSKLNIVTTFPLYVPNSAGSYDELTPLTIQAINQVFPCLSNFISSVKHETIALTYAKDFPADTDEFNAAENLKDALNKHGSDKSNHHNYHYVYGPILKNRNEVTGILEIGMGTNNTDVVSNMGQEGKPGASLRAFKEFLPNATIYGADVDKRILFEEDRIKTFYVDQTKSETLDLLNKQIPENLDLIIDDGLHSPNANIAVLTFALNKLKPNGWFVVEDISENAIQVWEVMAELLPKEYSSYLFQADNNGIAFAARKN
jgi:hypothetical protein